MARAWVKIDRVSTPDGELELRRRAADDYLMTIGGRVLMSSAARRSEEALGELAAEAAEARLRPRALIAGLGMGHTLRAALDCLPANARVEVAELNPVVVAWCRTELSELNGSALHDARVSVQIEDVADAIRRAAAGGSSEKYDVILLDLYVGPSAAANGSDPFYGREALRTSYSALRPGGVFGVWAEGPSEAFESELRRADFSVEQRRVGRGGRKHVIYLARSRP